MQLLRGFIPVFLLFVIFIACGKSEKQFGAKTIGVTLLTRTEDFYKDLEAGLNVAAKKHNFKLSLIAGERDLGRQISQIEEFVAKNVDAIVICPVASKGIGKGIKAANAAGIPIFTADMAAQEGEVICHVTSDNLAGGRLAGEYLAKLLDGKGQIAIINQPLAISLLDRASGFREALGPYAEIEIVKDVNGDGVRDRAMQAATDVLQAHPQLRAIFGVDDDSALGALDAVADLDRDDVIIIGYGATPAACDAILNERSLKADVVQYPQKIGEQTIEMIAKYFRGEEVPAVLPVPVGIVDKNSLQEAK
ncbi:MAG: substrate-binding domain-containing protein [bacterium]